MAEIDSLIGIEASFISKEGKEKNPIDYFIDLNLAVYVGGESIVDATRVLRLLGS